MSQADTSMPVTPGATHDCWQACPSDDLLFAEWSDGCAVHHRRSGLTHFLNESSVMLLREVLAEPQAFEAMEGAMFSHMLPEVRAQHAADLLRLLERLEALGLVSRVPVVA